MSKTKNENKDYDLNKLELGDNSMLIVTVVISLVIAFFIGLIALFVFI